MGHPGLEHQCAFGHTGHCRQRGAPQCAAAFHVRALLPALTQVVCSRKQRHAADGIPAFPGKHARWFKARSIICWQSRADNHLLRINTPPGTRQPPAPFRTSFPHPAPISTDMKHQSANGYPPQLLSAKVPPLPFQQATRLFVY